MKRFLFYIIIGFVFLTHACNRHESNRTVSEKVPQSEFETPSLAVKNFWAYTSRGDYQNASRMITAAPISYIDWEPGRKETEAYASEIRKKPPVKNYTGVGTANPDLLQDKFAEQLKGRIEGMHRAGWYLDSIISETIDGDKAQVVVNINSAAWVSFYKQRVLLKKNGKDWMLIALWD